MADYFNHMNCLIRELEMTEVDIEPESAHVILESLAKCHYLERISFCDNIINEAFITEFAQIMPRLQLQAL